MKTKEVYLSFGKHKGERLQDIPLRYLAWLLTKYEGTSLKREDIEAEAIRRGCEKRNGRWGINRPVKHGGFDHDGIGWGTMSGVIEHYDSSDAHWDGDCYSYEGIPNFD